MSVLISGVVGLILLLLLERWVGKSMASLLWGWLCVFGAAVSFLSGRWFWLVINLVALVWCFYNARQYSREEAPQ